VRAGLAALHQIDRSLEEASLTLRNGPAATVRRVVVPLLRPAIVAGLVYGFVTAMTTVSAVIFLVSPGIMLSTVYIVNLAEAGTYGMAIAYSSVLIVLMRAVTKRYGAFVAVDGVSFTIDKGAMVTLLGPSGCGKTTTLRLIAGLEMSS